MSQYREMAKRIRERARYEAINILVWGPGDPGPDAPQERRLAYAKRIQIRDVLRKEFPLAEVHFSEDPEMIRIADGIYGQLRKEALQASISHLILMLDISRGVDLELDYFVPKYPWFRDKVFVFLPEQYVASQGLVAEVFDYLKEEQIQGFSQEEFDSCHVATVKAVNVAHTVALACYLERIVR